MRVVALGIGSIGELHLGGLDELVVDAARQDHPAPSVPALV
jgi:hypothetical protein